MSMDPDIDKQRINAALDQLGEHYDAVQIFCSRHESGEEGGSIHFSFGCGNWFARYGQIRNWLVAEEEGTRIHVRANNQES